MKCSKTSNKLKSIQNDTDFKKAITDIIKGWGQKKKQLNPDFTFEQKEKFDQVAQYWMTNKDRNIFGKNRLNNFLHLICMMNKKTFQIQ